MTVRVGMIGIGWMGAFIVPDMAACERIELTRVAGRDAERTAAFATAHGIPRHGTVDDLLADDELDLIYITTTPESHADLTTRALEAGKGVLLEKAFTTNADEASAIIDLARDRGLFLMEAMWMRFNPVIRAAQAAVAEGRIGEPRMVHASFGMPFTDLSHRLWDPKRAGGSMLDQGVYPITFADIFLGEPETVSATGSTAGFDGTDAGLDSELAMLLGYSGGRSALLSSSLRAALPLTASVSGSAGRIAIDAPFWSTEGFSLVIPREDDERTEIAKVEHGYIPMLEAVIEALDNGWIEHPLCDHAASLRVMRTADRVLAELR